MKAVALRSTSDTQMYIALDDNVIIQALPTVDGQAAGVGDMLDKLSEISSAVTEVCRKVHETVVTGLGTSLPDEFEIEFGITLAGEAGVPFVTKGSAEAAFRITAKWTKEKPGGTKEA